MSEPVASGVMPAASAAADPPLDPPGSNPTFHGLRVMPHIRLAVQNVISNSGVSVRAWKIAPAARSRSTIGSSRSATLSCINSDPFVARLPAIAASSLIATGSPSSGRASPRAYRFSAARAAARASSTYRSPSAFTTGCATSIRSRIASRYSLGETLRSPNARSVSTADSLYSSLILPPMRTK
jgi:hypothetical protein